MSDPTTATATAAAETIFGRAVIADDYVIDRLRTRGSDDPLHGAQREEIGAALTRCRLVGWRPVQVQNSPHGRTVIFLHPRLGPWSNAHVGVNHGRADPRYAHQLVNRGNDCDDIPWDLRSHTYRQVEGVATVYGLNDYAEVGEAVKIRIGQQQTESAIMAGAHTCGRKVPRVEAKCFVAVSDKPEGSEWWPLSRHDGLFSYLCRYRLYMIDSDGNPTGDVSKATVHD